MENSYEIFFTSHLGSKKYLNKLLTAVIFSIAFSSCSGGSSSDEVQFRGTITITDSTGAFTDTSRASVAALGSSNVSTGVGLWNFSVPRSSYDEAMGSALFEVVGDDSSGTVVIDGLASDSSVVDIALELTESGMLSAASVVQDGNVLFGGNEILEQLDEDTTIADACEIISSSSILITDALNSFDSDNQTCPLPLSNFLTVENSGLATFEYVTSVDFGFIDIDMASGTLAPGSSMVLNANYTCGNTMSFDTLINARITKIILDDGREFTDDQLFSQCPEESATRRFIDTASLTVAITQ